MQMTDSSLNIFGIIILRSNKNNENGENDSPQKAKLSWKKRYHLLDLNPQHCSLRPHHKKYIRYSKKGVKQ